MFRFEEDARHCFFENNCCYEVALRRKQKGTELTYYYQYKSHSEGYFANILLIFLVQTADMQN